jgi:hypothetical protein
MIKDKVMYAELRPMLMDKSIPADDGIQKLSHQDQMNLIIEEVSRKKKSLQEVGKLEQFPFGLKIIYCAPRSIPKDWMQREMQDCIKLKRRFPDLICGKLAFYRIVQDSLSSLRRNIGLNSSQASISLAQKTERTTSASTRMNSLP